MSFISALFGNEILVRIVNAIFHMFLLAGVLVVALNDADQEAAKKASIERGVEIRELLQTNNNLLLANNAYLFELTKDRKCASE